MRSVGRRLLIATIAAVAFIASCGYRVVGMGGQLPGGVTRVEVPFFENRTARTEIGRLLTENFIGELLASGKVRMARAEEAQAVIQGTVTVYKIEPISFDAKQKPLESRLTIVMDAELVTREEKRVLFAEKGVTVRYDYQVKDDLQENDKLEDEARRNAAKQMSQKLVSLMLEGF